MQQAQAQLADAYLESRPRRSKRASSARISSRANRGIPTTSSASAARSSCSAKSDPDGDHRRAPERRQPVPGDRHAGSRTRACSSTTGRGPSEARGRRAAANAGAARAAKPQAPQARRPQPAALRAPARAAPAPVGARRRGAHRSGDRRRHPRSGDAPRGARAAPGRRCREHRRSPMMRWTRSHRSRRGQLR